MAQPQGYNQFSNYGPVPGQQQAGFQFQDRQRPTSNLNQTPPTGDPQRQQSQYPEGTFRQQPAMWQGMQQQQQPNAGTSQATQPAASQGAAGQVPPNSQPSATTQQAPSPPPMPQMNQQPSFHMEMGDYNAPGAWTNGYNPHLVQDPMVKQQPTYPQGTFQATQPAAASTSPAKQLPVVTPAGAPANQYERALAMGYPPSTSVDPMSGEGWKNGVSPQAFMQQNPYYGQTGYYGDLAQVQAQMAGGAQSAGIPQGVLGSDTYTQNPATATPWQPAATPQQLVQQDLSNWEANRWNPK